MRRVVCKKVDLIENGCQLDISKLVRLELK